MYNKFIKLLHSKDIFGYAVQLNFNRNGNIHTTAIGGVFSIILKALYIGYMGYLLMKLVTFADDKTYSFEYAMDPNDQIDYRNLNLNVYYAIYKVNEDGYSDPLFLTPETK